MDIATCHDMPAARPELRRARPVCLLHAERTIWASYSPLLELVPLCALSPPAFQNMTDSAVAKLPARLGLRVMVAAREGRERE